MTDATALYYLQRFRVGHVEPGEAGGHAPRPRALVRLQEGDLNVDRRHQNVGFRVLQTKQTFPVREAGLALTRASEDEMVLGSSRRSAAAERSSSIRRSESTS